MPKQIASSGMLVRKVFEMYDDLCEHSLDFSGHRLFVVSASTLLKIKYRGKKGDFHFCGENRPYFIGL